MTLRRELRSCGGAHSSDTGRKGGRQHWWLVQSLFQPARRDAQTSKYWAVPTHFLGPPRDAYLSCANTTCHIIWCLGPFSMLIFRHVLLLQNTFSKEYMLYFQFLTCSSDLILISVFLLWLLYLLEAICDKSCKIRPI